ncbi:MAG: PASTA domain-containing protein [Candidatus Hydrogenedentales bacterium]
MKHFVYSLLFLASAALLLPVVNVYGQASETCPDGSLFSQPPTIGTEPRIWGNDGLIDTVVSLGHLTYADMPTPFDDFTVSDDIGQLVWWGTETDLYKNPGDRFADIFSIFFYENAATDPVTPGAVYKKYENQLVTKEYTGKIYLFYKIYKYTLTLPEACDLREGWISIKGDLAGSVDPTDPNDPAKARGFVHMSSSSGNEILCEYREDYDPFRYRTGDRYDLALCLLEGPPQVPNVEGMLLPDAEAALADVGLIVGAITYDYSGSLPQGTVVSSDPPVGNLVPVGGAVNLVVAAEPILVPYVIGMTDSDAAEALANVGLTVGSITKIFSDTAPEDEVIQQGTAAGTSVAPGTAIDLVISRGVELPTPIASFSALFVLTGALAGVGVLRYRKKK